jgi:peptidoglycan hydrolase-like protein with peptidoglycan-binding domain
MHSRQRDASLCGIRPRAFVVTVTVGIVLAGALQVSSARGQGDAAVGALQVGLRAHGLYAGPVDGLFGPQTEKAVRALQRRRGLAVDGVPGRRTRAALGRYGRPRLGSRLLRAGAFGWDVAMLQFMLARCRTTPGAVDASFGAQTTSAVHRYQRRLGIAQDGVVGPTTLGRLRQRRGCGPPAGGIAAGVTVSGAHIGGLSAQWADAALRSAFADPVRVAARGRVYLVEPNALAHARFREALRRALAARPGAAFRLRVQVRWPRLRASADWFAGSVCRPPVNARLIGLRHLRPRLTRARGGCQVNRGALARALAKRLKGLDRSVIRIRTRRVRPAVTRSNFGPVVVVRRRSHRLALYDGTRFVRAFRIGTGKRTFPTPLGRFSIVWKARNPWWIPPKEDWAEDLDPIPPGPGNPLGTRWMGLSSPGVGIHGTPDRRSVGYSRSHGCIRMYVPHAEWLFRRVNVGTPVVIVAA